MYFGTLSTKFVSLFSFLCKLTSVQVPKDDEREFI